MSTPITTTVHLYPGTPRERLVKVEALVSLHYGKYRIDKLNPLEGGCIGAHELDAAYDAVLDAAHAYHGGTPDGAREGGFMITDAIIVVSIVGILFVIALSAFQLKDAVKRAPDALISYTTSSAYAPVLYTLKHDNHLFIASADTNTLLHHPDCPCVKAAPRTEVERANRAPSQDK